jgi:hypothetical protein
MAPAPPNEQLRLWSTPLGRFHCPQALDLNPTLVRVLRSLRATDPQAIADAPFYASRDDLLQRIRLPEWEALVRCLVEGVRDTAAAANAGLWPTDARGATPGLQIALQGVWFQISNRGVHHDIHTHGNCSWSGVYCLQVDGAAEREAHPVFGVLNGVTRFYGPHFQQLGGGHVDFGNAYLQQAHLDVAPQPGQLIVFPSWLAHQAMPYEGSTDRIIVSFNASVHAASGNDRLHGYARG